MNKNGKLQAKPVGAVAWDDDGEECVLCGQEEDDEADVDCKGGADDWAVPVGLGFTFDQGAIQCFRCSSPGPRPKDPGLGFVASNAPQSVLAQLHKPDKAKGDIARPSGVAAKDLENRS